MKSKILVAVGAVVMVCMLVVAGCSATGAAANDQPVTVNVSDQQTGIWVNGQGSKTVTPDLATMTLGVSSQKESVAEAQAEAAAAMDNLMNALKDNGVAAKDIQTSYFSIDQVTRWNDDTNEEIVVGYKVSNMITAKMRDIDNVGTVIDAVAAAGGDLVRINGINFSVENPETYYEEVRELALQDAKAKAEQIANETGVTLGKPTYVVENSNYSTVVPTYYRLDAAAGAESVKTAISAGETDITLNIQVAYAIQ
jgi:uncharacterized protein YggE